MYQKHIFETRGMYKLHNKSKCNPGNIRNHTTNKKNMLRIKT